MKRPGKLTFYLGFVMIVCFFVCSITGVSITDENGEQIQLVRGASDINWGIDVSGGVSVTFSADEHASSSTMGLLKERLNVRLEMGGLNDYELYVDETSSSILVSFPWVQNENGDAVEIIDYLSTTGCLRVVEGRPEDIAEVKTDESGSWLYDSTGQRFPVLMTNEYAESTEIGEDALGFRTITIRFNEQGKVLLAEGTGRQLGDKLTVWLDDKLVSTMSIYTVNTAGELVIGKGGGLDATTAGDIETYLRTGELPVEIHSSNYEITDPAFADDTLGIMVTAGAIALCIICAFLLIRYRMTGFVACVALIGHIGGLLAAASGFLPFFDGVTMTLPGIAGMMLSVGMAIDANIITAERIKEEIGKGKSLHGSIDAACRSSVASILDGNITMTVVAVILIGTFGPPNNICSILLSPFMWMFTHVTTGAIYAFGYMLFFGVIFNIIFSVLMAGVMLRSAAQNKAFHVRWLYGGAKTK